MKFYPLASLYFSFAVIIFLGLFYSFSITADKFNYLLVVVLVNIFWGTQTPEVYWQTVFILQRDYPSAFGLFSGCVAPIIRGAITLMMFYGSLFYLQRARRILSEQAFRK